ncbi:DUF4362 domain-containing protein [Bacillus atrophaeus]|uniref:DUF4362 domain-containing protein n=1 Tax=Bacillus atrophaeus TaxID=1452 RepID=UPI002E14B4B0
MKLYCKLSIFILNIGLENFIKKVQIHKKAEINYIHYGVEGQNRVEKHSYDRKSLHVFRSIDKEFIEEYQCETIEKQTGESETIYMLKQCADGLGDVELATVRSNK